MTRLLASIALTAATTACSSSMRLELPPHANPIASPAVLYVTAVEDAEHDTGWAHRMLDSVFPNLVEVQTLTQVDDFDAVLVVEVDFGEESVRVSVRAPDDELLVEAENEYGRTPVQTFEPIARKIVGDMRLARFINSGARPELAARFSDRPPPVQVMEVWHPRPQVIEKKEPPPVIEKKIAEERSAPAVVAVFAIENRGVSMSKSVLDQLQDYLVARLASTQVFEVVPPSQIKERLTEMKRASYDACYDESCQIEIGREVAAQKAIAGRIIELGSKCATTVSLYDLRKATLEHAATATGPCSEDEIIAALDRASAQLAATVK